MNCPTYKQQTTPTSSQIKITLRPLVQRTADQLTKAIRESNQELCFSAMQVQVFLDKKITRQGVTLSLREYYPQTGTVRVCESIAFDKRAKYAIHKKEGEFDWSGDAGMAAERFISGKSARSITLLRMLRRAPEYNHS